MVRGPSSRDLRLPIKVFDFFSGCGGTSRGFLNAGMDIVFALDNDPDAAKTFRSNFSGVRFVEDDIKNVACQELRPVVDACQYHPILFSASAPCQPYTKQKTNRPLADERGTLLNEFKRFVEEYRIELIFVENVPGFHRVEDGNSPFRAFLDTLAKLGYWYDVDVIAAQSYGVPQLRRRLVLVASRLGPIHVPKPTHGPGTDHEYSTVHEWIADLPPIAAGETHPTVLNHRAAALSSKNLKRIRSLEEGEDRRKWPKRLRLRCQKNGYKGHTDVYGRMRWKQPSSGLTTRCISLSNGRFGHPEQDRAISVREAACLQTFPMDFVFQGSLNSMARQIGNAVPVLLAERFGWAFDNHFRQHPKGRR